MKTIILSAFLFLIPTLSTADDVIRIEVGKNYDNYSTDELRRRIWTLERAVAQLQDQVFRLETRPIAQNTTLWTCRIESFGKTHVSSGINRSSALAVAIKKCSDASNAIHCEESKAKCDND